MFFLNQAKDAPLYQELIREGVMTAGLWDSLPLPSEGHLMDVLIGHRSKISDKPWIDWLIRKHNCTRVPALEPDFTFVKELQRSLVADSLKADCFPLRVGNNHLYIGIGRPDYPEHVAALQKFYKKELVYRNALCLNEISTLRNICKDVLQTV